jgi:hypothetical protein
VRPTPVALLAVGANGPLEPLRGGHAAVWRAGDVVVTERDVSPEELALSATLRDRISDPARLRLGLPLRAADGRHGADGWVAYPFLAGGTAPDRWDDVATTATDFADVLASFERPGFLCHGRR